MKAFVVDHYDVHTKIPITNDAPEPKAGKDEVIVEVYSAALNFFDVLQTQGKYQVKPEFPFVLGTEFAGRIASNSPIPKGCSFKPGDKVFGAGQGAFGERITVLYRQLLPVPRNMSFDQACGLSITWPTSYEALVGRAQLKEGEWVLVHAGAGGVGLAAVQLAKALGAKVIATAGSESKLDVCKQQGGADAAVNYRNKGWQSEVLKLTGGRGVDVIYDPVGLIQDSLKCIAWKGRALVIGFAAGQIEKLPLNLVLLKNISIVGLHWGAYLKKEPSHVPKVWDALFRSFESGKVQPVVYSKIYRGLGAVSAGLKSIEDRESWGKVIVRVKDEEAKPKL
jgi:NADPH2:quinone reductase